MEGKEAGREDKGGKKMREIERGDEWRRRKEKERWNGVRRYLVRKKKKNVSYNVVERERERERVLNLCFIFGVFYYVFYG